MKRTLLLPGLSLLAALAAGLPVPSVTAAGPPAAPAPVAPPPAGSGPGADASRTLLQQALFAEEAVRDLPKAAEAYERLLAGWDEQRQFAAVALFRLAEVRRKQDRKEEAALLYQRLLTEFGNVEPQAKMSRENLAALGVEPAASDPSSAAGEAPDDPEEMKELRRLMNLAQNSRDRLHEPVPWIYKGREQGKTLPLVNAAYNGWLKVAAFLLKNGADPNSSRSMGGVPLYAAASGGHKTLCELLLAHGADVKTAGDVMGEVIRNNYADVGELLVAKGIDLNQPLMLSIPPEGNGQKAYFSGTALTQAVLVDSSAWVDRLLALKVDVNARPKNTDWMSPLHVACWKRNLTIARQLLDAGADPNAVDALPDVSNIVILENLPGASGRGVTPLHYAAGHPELVAALLQKGAKAAVADGQGLTPLHLACFAGKLESVRLLLAAGADPHARCTVATPQGRAALADITPLHGVYWEAPAEIVEALLAAGAKPDVRDAQGRTPFQQAVAAFYHAPGALEAMLKAGVPVDLPRADGSTELWWAFQDEAAATNSPQSPAYLTAMARRVDRLLAAGADPERLVNGKPVFHFASAERGLAILRERIYPRLVETPAVHLSLADARQQFRLALRTEEADQPPSLEELLAARAESAGDPKGLAFQTLAIWRQKKPGGGVERLPVKLEGLEPFPALQWGDVVEVDSVNSPASPAADAMSMVRARLVRKVTVQIGGLRQELTLRGRLQVYDPSVPEAPLVTVAYLLQVLGINRPEYTGDTVTVSHSAAKGGGKLSWVLGAGGQQTALPEDGDTITVTGSGEKQNAGRTASPCISLIVPGKMGGAFVEWPKNPVMQQNPGDDPAGWVFNGTGIRPTLMQLLAEVYAALPVASPFVPNDDGILPEADPVASVTAALLNNPAARWETPPAVITWPDWAGVKIRRTEAGGEKKVIPVDLAAAMAALKEDSPAEDARRADVPLLPGDVVELPVLAQHPDEPWPGLEESAVRLFRKALESKVIVVDTGGRFREVTVSWLPPRWVQTPAGIIAMLPERPVDGRVPSLRVSALLASAAPGATFRKLVRDGKEISVTEPGGLFLRSGDVLHVGPPEPRRAVPGPSVPRPAVPYPAPAAYIPGQSPVPQPQPPQPAQVNIPVPNGNPVPAPPRRRIVLPTQPEPQPPQQ